MTGPTSDDPPVSRVIEGLQESIASERDRVAGERVGHRDEKQVHDWIRGAASRVRPPSTPPAQMSIIDAATIFDACRERLQGLLGDDADITVVEHAIAGYPLDDEEKAALWLWAIAPFDPATLSRHMLRDGT